MIFEVRSITDRSKRNDRRTDNGILMAKDEKKQSAGRAPALEKGLDIIELLSETNQPMTLREVAAGLGRSKNELYRMISVLLERGYLNRNVNDMITLTSKLFELGLRTPQTHDLVSLASPIIQDLATKVQNSVYLGVPRRDKIVVIAATSGSEDVNFSLKLGYHIPLLQSNSGLVVLAFQTATGRERILSRSSDTKTQVKLTDAVQNQLTTIKRHGYLISPSKDTHGVTDVVAPIHVGDEAIGVITVNHLDRKRDPSDKHVKVLKFVTEACTQLTKLLDTEKKKYIV